MRSLLFVCLLFGGAVSFGQGTSGLEAHWDFSGSANDISGNSHNGTVSGAVLTSGAIGLPNTAYRFNGSGDHIDVPYATGLNLDTFSILSYVKFHGFYGGTCQGNYIVSRGYEFSGNFYSLFVTDNNYDGSCTAFMPDSQSFASEASGSFPYLTTYWRNGGLNPVLDTGVLYCAATTYDGDSIRQYLNGNLVVAGAWAYQYTGPTTLPLGIGYLQTGGSAYPYWINADVDDIRLYRRPLSGAEVLNYCDSFSAGPLPTGSLFGTPACPGAPALLTFTATAGTGPFTLTLTGPGGSFTVPGVVSGVPFALPSGAAAGTYTLTSITDASGAVNASPGASAIITLLANPAAAAGPDRTVCGPTPVTLFGSGFGTPSWSPATGLSSTTVFTPTATVSTTTTYVLTVTSPDGCVGRDTVSVKVPSLANLMVSADTASACEGDSVVIGASGGTRYRWYPSAGLSSDTGAVVIAAPAQSTTYRVIIREDSCGLIDTLQVRVEIRPQPRVRATASNPLNCSYDYAQLQASGAAGYAWTPVSSLNNAGSDHPIAMPAEPTVYTVEGTDVYGCTGKATVFVDVALGGTRPDFPSAFSPNGDGRNDCFGMMFSGPVKDYEFRIFNRWGQMVYSTIQTDGCWDGTFEGVPQDLGVYMYYFRGKMGICGPLEGKGDVTLIR